MLSLFVPVAGGLGLFGLVIGASRASRLIFVAAKQIPGIWAPRRAGGSASCLGLGYMIGKIMNMAKGRDDCRMILGFFERGYQLVFLFGIGTVIRSNRI